MRGDLEGIDCFTCLLCWEPFDSPVALLAHEEDEECQDWPVPGYAPSTAAATQ